MGNAVSNQRKGSVSALDSAHTEDGVLFSVTFEKYSDGKVYLAGTDVIPTWVNMHSNQGKKEYNILPLMKENEEQWKEVYELTDNQLTFCQKSYDRTMSIVGEGLEACQTYLAQEKEAREQYYYDLAMNPELFATEATAEIVAEETTLPAA